MDTFLSKKVDLLLQILRFTKNQENELISDIIVFFTKNQLFDFLFIFFSMLKIYNTSNETYVVTSDIKNLLYNEYKKNEKISDEKLQIIYNFYSSYYDTYKLNLNSSIQFTFDENLIIPNEFNSKVLYYLTDYYVLESFQLNIDFINPAIFFNQIIKGNNIYQDTFVILATYFMSKKYKKEFLVF